MSADRKVVGIRSEDPTPYNPEAMIRSLDESAEHTSERIVALATVAKAAIATLKRERDGTLIDALSGTLAEIVRIAREQEETVRTRAAGAGCSPRD
jgi:hypothetical protein